MSDHDKRLRAELAAELGYFLAALAPDDIERHRLLNAASDSAPSQERIGRRYAYLREQKRRTEVEADGRTAVSDLYDLPVTSESLATQRDGGPVEAISN